MVSFLIMLLGIVQLLLRLFTYLVVIQAIMSWLIAFNVINTFNEYVRGIWNGLRIITEPFYRPIRRIMPDFGALDLSPMVLLILLVILNNYVIDWAIRMLASSGGS